MNYYALMAYIALLGRSIWATLNTYYAMLLETDYRPELVWLLVESNYEDKLTSLGEGFEIISMGFDFQPTIRSKTIPTGSIAETGPIIRKLHDELQSNYKTALDITSARKAAVAGALLATSNAKPDHIYYLEIDSLEETNKPYVMIPFQRQKLHDLRAETRRPLN